MKVGFPQGVGQSDHCRLRLRVASTQTPNSDALRIDAILARNRSADFLLCRDGVDVLTTSHSATGIAGLMVLLAPACVASLSCGPFGRFFWVLLGALSLFCCVGRVDGGAS